MGDVLNERKEVLPLINQQQQASSALTERDPDQLLVDQEDRTAASVRSTAEGSEHLLLRTPDAKKHGRLEEEEEQIPAPENKGAKPRSTPSRGSVRERPTDKEESALPPKDGRRQGSGRASTLNSRLAQLRRADVEEIAADESKLHQAHRQDSWVNRLVTDSTQQKEKAAASAKSLLSVGADCYNGPLESGAASGILGAVGTAVSTGSTILRGTARGEDDEESEPGEALNSAVGFAGKKLRKRGRGRDSAGRSGKRGVAGSAESRAGGTMARQAQDSVVKPVQKETAAQAASAAAKLRQAAIKAVKDLVSFVSATIASTFGPLVVGAAILVTIVVVLLNVFTATTEGPFGLFFVTESEQELEMSAAISRLTNSYYSKFYDILLAQDYDELEAVCSITDSDEAWKNILSLYAVEVCKEGKSPAVMDEEHYDILEKVFWEYIHINFHTSVSYDEYTENDAGDDEGTTTETVLDEFGNEIEVEVPTTPVTTRVEFKTLTITISTSSVEEVAANLGFTEEEIASVQELLDEGEQTWAALVELFQNLIISVDGTPGSFDVTAYSDVAETVFRACVEAGYSVEAACGILGNIQQECSMNPHSSSGGAFGLCQWMGGRLNALKRLSDYSSAETQTGFLLYELNRYTSWWTTYGREVNHTYKGKKITSLSDFKECNDPEAAAGAFCIVFERSGEFPGNKWYEARLKYAKSWYEYAQSHWLSASGATGTAADILEACQKLANIIYGDNDWHYDGHFGHLKSSFKAARSSSKHRMDCGTYVSYVLQEVGILSPGQTLYSSSGGSLKCRGKNTRQAIKRKCEIIYVGKKVKDCGSILQPGDICGMTTHICIFSDTKGGDMYWWSAGGKACKKGKFKWLYKHYPSYQGRGGKKGQTIHFIIRPKR